MNTITLKERLLRWRRHLALAFGKKDYCRVGQWKLMEELFLNRPPGIFFEAGGHDGWSGSNTYWLEASMGWRGVLVEPVPQLFKVCCKERPLAKVFRGALVPEGYRDEFMEIEVAGLVSTVKDSGMLLYSREVAQRLYGKVSRTTVAVPTLTINRCLEESGTNHLDFLSLDIEGYEAQALRGLNLERWKPEYMLIECNYEAAVREVLDGRYEVARRLPPHDILFRRRD